MKKEIMVIIKLIGIGILGTFGFFGIRYLAGLIKSITCNFYAPIQIIVLILCLVYAITIFCKYLLRNEPK